MDINYVFKSESKTKGAPNTTLGQSLVSELVKPDPNLTQVFAPEKRKKPSHDSKSQRVSTPLITKKRSIEHNIIIQGVLYAHVCKK